MSVPLKVFSFYRFVALPGFDDLRQPLLSAARERELLGTILLAAEGINGSIAGTEASIRWLLAWLAATPGLEGLDGRWTTSTKPAFQKMRVRLRNEIVTLGRPDLNPGDRAGKHVQPADWNALLSNPATVLVDVRNDYEIDVGSFPGCINPGTRNFREFPDFVEQQLGAYRDKPIAMYCTGGVRCEKASALLLDQGFSEVYQLDGGVLGYLDSVPAADNLWNGECFVFDSRVAVDSGLTPGNYVQCHACRRPLSREDLESEHYEPGIACAACYKDIEPERRERLAERRRQLLLAAARSKSRAPAAGT